MMDTKPVTTKVYEVGELKQAAKVMGYLLSECDKGNVDQHLSPAFYIAIDCISQVIAEREPECPCCGGKVHDTHCKEQV